MLRSKLLKNPLLLKRTAVEWHVVADDDEWQAFDDEFQATEYRHSPRV